MLWLLPGALTPLLVHSSSADASDPDRDRTAVRAVEIPDTDHASIISSDAAAKEIVAWVDAIFGR